MNISYLKNLGVLILFLMVTAVLYGQTVNDPFYFDDYYYIVNNLNIRDLSQLSQVGSALRKPARYLTFLTFALNYRLHGLELWGYHVVNMIIHVSNAFLVWLLLGCFQQIKGEGERRSFIPLMGSLLFLVHPLQTQGVNYLCQRFASLATVMYLLTVYLYVRGRLSARYSGFFFVGAGCAAVVGMFTKQTVFTVVFMIPIIEMILFRSSIWKSFSKKQLLIAGAAFAGIFSVVPAMYGFNLMRLLDNSVESWSHLGDTVTPMTYFLTQGRVLVTYLRLFVAPLGQNLLYDFPLSQSLFETTTAISFLLLGALLVWGITNSRRRPWVALGIVWFFVALSIESSVFILMHVIFEHRCYLAFFGFILVVCGGLPKVLLNEKKLQVAFLIIIITFSVQTFQRNRVWSSDVTLWGDVMRKSPKFYRPYQHLGAYYERQGQPDVALSLYSQALATVGEDAEMLTNRGNAHYGLGMVEEALQDYSQSIALDASLSKPFGNRATLFSRMGQTDKALEDFRQALIRHPDNQPTLFNRGNLYMKLGQWSLALDDYKKLIRLNPYHASAYAKLGVIYVQMEDWNSALSHFDRAVALNPSDGRSFYNRSVVNKQLGDKSAALSDVLKARSLGFNIDEKYINSLRTP